MGKITFYLGEISGRVGGLVFSKNKAGNYIKNFTRQNNPSTAVQTQQRAKFVDIISIWSGLTEDQRIAWRAISTQVYDRFGVLRTLDGRELFIALNRNLQLVDEAILLDPPIDLTAPTQFTNPVTVETSFIIDPPDEWEGSNWLTLWWDEALMDDEIVALYTTRPLPNTRINPGNQSMFSTCEYAVVPGLVFHQAYYMKYGAWPAATYNLTFALHLQVYIIKISNGKTTPPVNAYVVYGTDKQIYP